MASLMMRTVEISVELSTNLARSRGKKLCVWISNYEKEDCNLRIGRRIKEVLQHTGPVVFQSIADQEKHASNKSEDVGSYSV